jgi:S-adenosylmethionine/arginine decarboxylase-like enzyme
MLKNSGHGYNIPNPLLDIHKQITVNDEKYYGQHMLVDTRRCNERITSIPDVTRFIKELVGLIDMVGWQEPMVTRFPEDKAIGSLKGVSAIQLIYTSSITLHGHDNTRDMYLDIFSCKEYDTDKVESFVKEFFSPVVYKSQTVLRK